MDFHKFPIILIVFKSHFCGDYKIIVKIEADYFYFLIIINELVNVVIIVV